MIFTDLPGRLKQYCFRRLSGVYRLYKPYSQFKCWEFTSQNDEDKCTWLRQNSEHCAQRKDPTEFWGPKTAGNRSQRLKSVFSQMLRNAIQCNWHILNVSGIYFMHQRFSDCSPPLGWPWTSSNFWQWIFWKLSASPSETTWSKLGLDKRKFKSAGWILRNLQFSEIFNYIGTGHNSCRFARPARAILLERLF